MTGQVGSFFIYIFFSSVSLSNLMTTEWCAIELLARRRIENQLHINNWNLNGQHSIMSQKVAKN